MRTARWIPMAALTAVALWLTATTTAQHHTDGPAAPAAHHVPPATQPHHAVSTDAGVSAHLAAADEALTGVEKAVRDGNRDAALAKVKDVRSHIRQAAALSRGFANTKCPVMGGSFDPATIGADLTREFNGRKVGFCCAGCPDAWDKLTDAEKQAKLTAAK